MEKRNTIMPRRRKSEFDRWMEPRANCYIIICLVVAFMVGIAIAKIYSDMTIEQGFVFLFVIWFGLFGMAFIFYSLEYVAFSISRYRMLKRLEKRRKENE